MCASFRGYSVVPETFDTLTALHGSPSYNIIKWEPLFVLPGWLRVWSQAFGAGNELFVRSVQRGEQTVGIVPLRIWGDTAYFIGDADVCDYEDFPAAPGTEREFLSVMLDDLRQKGVRHLDLKPVRPESLVLTSLAPLAREKGYEVSTTQDDVSLETDLPATWEEYLGTLNRKQRHEVRRKLRRLSEEGSINYRVFSGVPAVDGMMDKFLELFKSSREDKAAFLTEQREGFFRSLAHEMSQAGLLRIGALELESQVVAAVMYFDYQSTIYLYNSGYDPRYKHLNVGLMSKVWCIRESIAGGKAKFDFLRGGEDYKYHLGGREVPLFRCQLSLA